VSINSKRPYEVAPIPGFNSTIPKIAEPPRGKGIVVTVSVTIPFAQIYNILKDMFGSGQATPEDLQRAASELRKVADQLEDLASAVP